MKVYCTSTHGNREPHSENIRDTMQYAVESIESSRSKYLVAQTVDSADIILYIEPPNHKFRHYAHDLLKQDPIRRYPNRCFVVEFTDGSAGFLPGVYVGIPRSRADYARLRSGCYLGLFNPLGTETTSAREREDIRPDLFMSFRGFPSSAVRRRIFDTTFDRKDVSIVETSTFGIWTQTEDSRRAFYNEMLRSKFVLCPRGNGLTTARLFETMERGRAPVILADDWWPPEGPAWSDFSVQVSESKVSSLVEILSGYESEAMEMGRLAREAWERWFSPEVRVLRTLQSIEDIMLYRPANHDEREYQRGWLGWEFAWRNGWTIPQKAARRVGSKISI